MTSATGPAVTGALHSAFYVIPVFWMWIYPQPAAGTVASDAHIAIGMTRLARDQILARFTCMATGPLMRRQNRIHMADLALVFIEALVRRSCGADGQTAETALVRNAGQGAAAEIAVTVTAVVGFMTAAAQLWIGARGQGMGNVEIAGVYIVHVVAEAAHFISKAGGVTLQTFVLLMAGGAVHAVAFCFSAVVKCPC